MSQVMTFSYCATAMAYYYILGSSYGGHYAFFTVLRILMRLIQILVISGLHTGPS